MLSKVASASSTSEIADAPKSVESKTETVSCIITTDKIQANALSVPAATTAAAEPVSLFDLLDDDLEVENKLKNLIMQEIKELNFSTVDQSRDKSWFEPIELAELDEDLIKTVWNQWMTNLDKFHIALQLIANKQAAILKLLGSKELPDQAKNELYFQATPLLCQNNQRRYISKKNGQLVNLTGREIECLKHLIDGKSTKVTARLMNISPRTVEFHLSNIKIKTHCRTKLEILSNIEVHS